MRTLAVLGAGPKAVAVAAKAHALRTLGYDAPHVVAVDHRGVAGNWLPGGGWTDGQQKLGTSPEKDVGFPYRSTLVPGGNAAVNAAMQQFSWQSYLIDHGGYAEWVDRARPAPRHKVWADYLRWAAGHAELDVVTAQVVSVATVGEGWMLTGRRANGEQSGRSGDCEIAADDLMITGPGPSTTSLLPGHPRVLSVAAFWQFMSDGGLPAAGRIAVIGGGETAASVLEAMAGRVNCTSVLVLSPSAALYTRGESYFENCLYSDPSAWSALPADERLELIRRTDRGVFSPRVQQTLLADNRIRHVPGRVEHAVGADDAVQLSVRGVGSPTQTHTFDLVVDAAGGDPLWFLGLFGVAALDAIESIAGWPVTQSGLQAAIGPDLAVAGMTPRLFLPNLAGFTQGPGFPNLSCLGLLSDRVIGALRTALASPRSLA